MSVIKRDGSTVSFDASKIINAINKAFVEVDGQLYENDTATDIALEIGKVVLNSPVDIEVETIQNWVEDYLMRSERQDVARAYIRYRYKKEVARKIQDDFIAPIKEKLEASDVQNQNANVDEHSFGGRMGEAASYMTKQYALDYLLSDMARENHINNEIYIHDLDHYALGDHNCLSIPFDDLLAKGFNTRQTDVRPAGSVNTACQLVAVIFQLQSLQQFGGVSATHIDWTMVPYIRKSFYKHFKDGVHYIENKIIDQLSQDIDAKEIAIDSDFYKNLHCPNAYDYAMDMTERETHQAVEGLYHNLNTLQSRSGNQLPFTSLNYGTCTLPEGRMFTKALLDVSIEGLGKLHKTSIFPCGIFQYMKGVNDKPGTPNYDLYRQALQSTAKRLYPNYANVDWTGNIGYDRNDPCTYFSTMGCRTSNGSDINAEPGVNPQRKDGRGNICPVTIILPTLAMEAKQMHTGIFEDYENSNTQAGIVYQSTNIIENFMTLLDKKIHEAKDMLLERFDWICSQSPASAKFMYENGTMGGYHPEEGIRSALKHGTLVVG